MILESPYNTPFDAAIHRKMWTSKYLDVGCDEEAAKDEAEFNRLCALANEYLHQREVRELFEPLGRKP